MKNLDPYSDPNPVRTLWSRGEIIFAVSAAALAAGVFVPMPQLALDIVWVCVLSLTLTGAVIFPAAASTADLKGFSALLSAPSLMRVALVGAVCVRLFGDLPAGRLIPSAGRTLTASWPLPAALLCLLVAAVAAVALFGACQRIAAAAVRYRERIYPLKCVGIETDLKMAVITPQQARGLAEKVRAEYRLFANLSGTSLLMRTEAALEIAALLGCLVYPFFSTAGRWGSGYERLTAGAAAAVGLLLFSLIPAVISSLAAAYLAGKDSLTLRAAPTRPPAAGRTFTLIDQETGRSEEVELLNPDSIGRRRPSVAAAEDRIAEFEPANRLSLIETLTFSAGSADAYYRQLAARIRTDAAASPVVIFAAQTPQTLPVTIFVNTAIQLVKEGHSLLLVDADTRRNALAQVFDADPAQMTAGIQTTGFDGLSLCGLGDVPDALKAHLDEAAKTFSCVLVYAPDTGVLQTACAVFDALDPSAFVFGASGGDNIAPFIERMSFCHRFRIVPAPAFHSAAE